MKIIKYIKIIWRSILKEYKVLIRRPVGLILMLILPLLLLIVFGVSFPGEFLKMTHAPILIIENEENQQFVNSLVEKIESEDFEITIKQGNEDSLRELIGDKKYLLGIYPYIDRSGGDVFELKNKILIDNSHPLAIETLLTRLIPKLEQDNNFIIEEEKLYGEALGFVDYLFPGIIALGIMFFTLNLASVGVARERVLGTLERVLASPVPLWVFLVAKYLSYILLSSVAGMLLLFGGKFLFDIQIAGSIWLVMLLGIFTAMPFIGIALISSIIGRSEFEAFAIAEIINIPMIFVCGIFFPIDCMPDYIQAVARVLPLAYSTDALRDVIIRGWGFSEISHPLLILSLYALATFILTIIIFKKRK